MLPTLAPSKEDRTQDQKRDICRRVARDYGIAHDGRDLESLYPGLSARLQELSRKICRLGQYKYEEYRTDVPDVGERRQRLDVKQRANDIMLEALENSGQNESHSRHATENNIFRNTTFDITW